MIERLRQHLPEIIETCRKYGVKRLELFGSAARSDFSDTSSDVDFFFEFADEDRPGLADRFFELKESLEHILGAPVDLVSSLDATNPYFLQVANQNRVTLHAA